VLPNKSILAKKEWVKWELLDSKCGPNGLWDAFKRLSQWAKRQKYIASRGYISRQEQEYLWRPTPQQKSTQAQAAGRLLKKIFPNCRAHSVKVSQ